VKVGLFVAVDANYVNNEHFKDLSSSKDMEDYSYLSLSFNMSYTEVKRVPAASAIHYTIT